MFDLTTYEIISIVLAVGMFVLAGVSIWIAIWSSRQATKEVNRLINETNNATRANIAVEIDKLEVEKFRLSMQMLDLEAKKKKILEDPAGEAARHKDSARALIDAINGQLDRCKKLHTEMGLIQLNMQEQLRF